jgi:uracil-DNA glycosylase
MTTSAHLRIASTFEAWRNAARLALAHGLAPRDVVWSDERSTALIATTQLADASIDLTVPRAFVDVTRLVSHHRDESKRDVPCRILFRLTHGAAHLLEDATDDDVIRLRAMERSIRRDLHKMHAFVRFRSIRDEAGEYFVAYHEPEHFIVPLAAAFFRERFAVMRWTIFTP